MAKQKLNAAQRRARNAAEKLARALYTAGKTKPAEPQKMAKRRKAAEAVKEAQREESRFLNETPDVTSQKSKSELMEDVRRLHDIAYWRYYQLMQQGTPNAATSIYETEFAGMDPGSMTINELRAMAHKLRRWLRRKDVSAKRARRGQNKTLEYLKAHGFPDVTADDLPQFFDMLAKYHEIYGGYNRYAIQYFASAYAAEIDNPLESMEEIFARTNEELRREYERNNGADTFGNIQLSPPGGVQSPDAPGVSAPGPEPARAPRPPRKQRKGKNRKKAERRRKNAQRKAELATRKANARKKR